MKNLLTGKTLKNWKIIKWHQFLVVKPIKTKTGS
jgi:hypothetical protein